MKIGIGLGDATGGGPRAIGEMIETVKTAETEGFASAWIPNIFGIDAIVFCALAGRETSRIELGTAVVPTYPRHPVAMAQAALTAAAACDGRFTLGIGPSHQFVIEDMFGLSRARPFSHTREYVQALTPLLRGEAASHRGEEYRFSAQFAVTGATAPPLLVAALAPRMLRMTAQEAAGTITWMTGPRTLAEYLVPRINAAAQAAGRNAPRVVCGLPVAVCDDPDAARATIAQAFALYGSLPSYRAMLDREGVEGPGGIAMVGDEASVGRQLDRLAEAGVTDLHAAIFAADGGGSTSFARTRACLRAWASSRKE